MAATATAAIKWRHNTRHKDTQHNGIQYGTPQHNDTQHNLQNNDIINKVLQRWQQRQQQP